ncbi:MAG: Lrp/AsnC family transcriptional regulator [Promethearchaeota archaeon]
MARNRLHIIEALGVQNITESEQKVLWELMRNSRSSLAALSERISKSRNWVARTIKKLVRNRVILAYVTVFDPAQVYAERNTILLLKTNPRELDVSAGLLDMPELESLDGISGDHSLLGLFRFRGSGSFVQFLDNVDHVVAKAKADKYQLVQVLTTYKTHGYILTSRPVQPKLVSSKDWDLLRIIYRQAPTRDNPFPLSQSEIGDRMRPCLSQPAVSKAIRRLEEREAIVGYSADIKFTDIGLPIKFFLQIKPIPGTIAQTAQKVSMMNEVWDLHRTSEDYSLFATVRTDSVEGYNQFLRRLYMNEAILDTQSQISLEEWFVPVRS